MAQTVNFSLEKPDIERNVDEEFYQLQETLDAIDAILKDQLDAIATKAASGHTHEISDVTGLASELASKMSSSASFKLDNLTDVSGADSAPNQYVLVKSEFGWVPSSALAALGAHGHTISEITGLIDALAAKLDSTNLATINDSIAQAVPAGAVMPFARSTAPGGWLKANGATVLRADYTALDASIYVGDVNNATASSGYRCTNPANPTGSRATTGNYLVIPDLRGEFVRGLDDGKGVDSGRILGSLQADEIKSHVHNVDPPSTTTSSDTHDHEMPRGGSGAARSYVLFGPNSYNATFDQGTDSDTHSHTVNISPFDSAATGGTETRPRNVALLYCIKY